MSATFFEQNEVVSHFEKVIEREGGREKWKGWWEEKRKRRRRNNEKNMLAFRRHWYAEIHFSTEWHTLCARTPSTLDSRGSDIILYCLQATTTEKYKHTNDTNVHIYKYFQNINVIFGEEQNIRLWVEFHIFVEKLNAHNGHAIGAVLVWFVFGWQNVWFCCQPIRKKIKTTV